MFEDMLFVLMWLIMPIGWHYLMKAAGLSLFRITIPSFIVIAIYAYQYIGLPVLYFQLNDYRAEFVTDKWLMMQVFFYTSLTLTLMMVGFAIARQHFGKLNWGVSQIYFPSTLNNSELLIRRHYKHSQLHLNAALFFLIAISFCVLITYIVKVGIENVALFIAFNPTSMSVEAARSAMGNSFDGKYHWYKVFMNDLLLFYVFVLVAQYLMRKTVITSMMMVITFLIAAFVMLMSLEKAPMANLIISIFLTFIVVRFDRQMPIKKIIYLLSGLILLLATFYICFMNVSAIASINSVFSRAFTGQIQPAYHYLDYFQNHHDLLLGASFPNPGGVFPFEHFQLSQEIMIWHDYNNNQTLPNVVGSMPTIFWGELYANFGFIGVLVFPIFVGYVTYWINIIIFRTDYNAVSIGLFIWILMHFITLSGTGLSSFILNIYMFFVVLFFLFLSFYLGQGKMSFRKTRTKLS